MNPDVRENFFIMVAFEPCSRNCEASKARFQYCLILILSKFNSPLNAAVTRRTTDDEYQKHRTDDKKYSGPVFR